MLLCASLTIELLKFWMLITGKHFQAINLAVHGLAYVKEDFVATYYLYLMEPMMNSLIWLMGIVP